MKKELSPPFKITNESIDEYPWSPGGIIKSTFFLSSSESSL